MRRAYCLSCGYDCSIISCLLAAIDALRGGYDFGDCICPNCWADESMLEFYFDD